MHTIVSNHLNWKPTRPPALNKQHKSSSTTVAESFVWNVSWRPTNKMFSVKWHRKNCIRPIYKHPVNLLLQGQAKCGIGVREWYLNWGKWPKQAITTPISGAQVSQVYRTLTIWVQTNPPQSGITNTNSNTRRLLWTFAIQKKISYSSWHRNIKLDIKSERKGWKTAPPAQMR